MMTLLRSLHSIAARRGDGLRPELLAMTTPAHGWPPKLRLVGSSDKIEPPECSKPVAPCSRHTRITKPPLGDG